MTPLADVARAMFATALEAVRPNGLIRRLEFGDDGVRFRDAEMTPAGRLLLVSLGKAAPGLADAFLKHARRAPDDTFVLAPHGVPASADIEPFMRRGSHPVPDAAGEAATGELLDLLASLDPADGVVVLLSGGSSALLARPGADVSRDDVVAVTRALLGAGAPIFELNAVRKHLLAAAGGRLAARCPASMLTLVISDVPGDDLATIASGPTVADHTTFADALAVLERRGLAGTFPRIAATFRRGAAGEVPESPKPGDPRLARSRVELLGTSRDALDAAADAAHAAGFRTAVLTRTLRGEARVVGECLAAAALATAPAEPLAVLAAGETTVTVTGEGRGGRNLELALAAACALTGSSERCLLAGGSDGVDGLAPAAGAVVDGSTVQRGRRRGRDPLDALSRNDAWGFFEGLEEAIVTGPTGTNVADLTFILVGGGAPDYVGLARERSIGVPTRCEAHPRQNRKPT